MTRGEPGRAPGFEFATAGRIVFGEGRAAELAAVVAGLGTRVFAVTGAHPDRHAGLLDDLGSTLDLQVRAMAGEPTIDDAREALAQARGFHADVVVGIGGGSPLDLAKAVAVLLPTATDPLDHLEVVGGGLPLDAAGAPFVAVPTTAGTGSEVTANAVLAVPAHGLKASLRSPHMLARVAVVDPLLAIGAPVAVTTASGLDALTQCLEPYVSRRANPMTDALAAHGLHLAGQSLLRCCRDGQDRDARGDMAMCSLLGGLALANAKLGVVHGVAGVLGGLLRAPHGMLCAATLGASVAVNLAALRERAPDSPAVARYAAAARILTGDPGATAADGIEWIQATCSHLGVPTLGDLGLREADVDSVADAASRASSTQGNPIALTHAELCALLRQAIADPARSRD